MTLKLVVGNEKKNTPTVSKINLQVDTQILEDGSLWMRTKLDIGEEWGEWELVWLSYLNWT